MFQSCGWRPLTNVQTHVMEHNNVNTASITLRTLTEGHGLKGQNCAAIVLRGQRLRLSQQYSWSHHFSQPFWGLCLNFTLGEAPLYIVRCNIFVPAESPVSSHSGRTLDTDFVRVSQDWSGSRVAAYTCPAADTRVLVTRGTNMFPDQTLGQDGLTNILCGSHHYFLIPLYQSSTRYRGLFRATVRQLREGRVGQKRR